MWCIPTTVAFANRMEDCLGWATKTCMQLGLKFYEVDFEAFGFLSGNDLLQFSLSDFCRKIDKVHGPKFYESFQIFLERQNQTHRNNTSRSRTEQHYGMCDDTEYGTVKEDQNWDRPPLHVPEPPVEKCQNCTHLSSSHDFQPSPRNFSTSENIPNYYNNHTSSSATPIMDEEIVIEKMDPFSYQRCCYSSAGEDSLDEPERLECNYPCASEQTPTGVSRKLSQKTDSKEKKWKLKIKNKTRPKRVRDPFVWEFLLMLLQDQDFNPSHIRWEDKSKGTFKLIQKEEIAKEWGQRTEKHKQAPLSYGHFSRSLRYHYTSGYLLPVSEKHLVYKFGPKVMEWLTMDGKMPN